MNRSMIIGAVALCLPLAAAAQTLPDLDRRVTRLEREVGRVAKRVLPKGEATLIAPDIDSGAPAPAPAAPPPASAAALADLTERVAAAERRQRELTGQVEDAGQRLRALEERLARFQPDAETRLIRLEARLAAGALPVDPAQTAPAAPIATPTPTPTTPAPAPAPAPAPKPVGADAEYKAAFALVEAKQWSAAEDALAAFVTAHPADKRASNARYWRGRSIYARGDFDRAAREHYANFRADARGERAQESLFWVGASLVKLKRTKQACQIYDLARATYKAELKPELMPQFAAARARAACAA